MSRQPDAEIIALLERLGIDHTTVTACTIQFYAGQVPTLTVERKLWEGSLVVLTELYELRAVMVEDA